MVRRHLILALGVLFVAVAGCNTLLDYDEATALFEGSLDPVNGTDVTGTVEVSVDSAGDVRVEVQASGLVDGEVHPQHIHASSSCPTPELDADGDGLVELSEGATAYGGAIIPLDNDLSDGGANTFPTGAPIDYAETVAFSALESANPESSLDLEERTVVVHGAYVKDGQVVPPDSSGAEYRATLPVACATLVEDIEDTGGY